MAESAGAAQFPPCARLPNLETHTWMITIREKDSAQTLGTISERDLQYLVDLLEEESSTDTDYYINAPTIDMLEEDGASAELVQMLRRTLDGRDGVDIEWVRT